MREKPWEKPKNQQNYNDKKTSCNVWTMEVEIQNMK